MPHPRNADQYLLPFAEKEYIDVKRAAHILGVCEVTIYNLWESGKIEIIDYAPRKRKRVRYSSVLRFCDELRSRYHIEDRRPPLENTLLRHKDENLLPFPLSDTMSTEAAARVLGYDSTFPVHSMIDEGRFEAYKISNISPWRISRTSLSEFVKRVHENAMKGRRTYLQPAITT